MRRIGKASALWGLTTLLLTLPAQAAVEFSQQADRSQVGQDDPFQLTVVVSDVPDGSSLSFPSSPDFEVLGRQESQSSSFSLINGHPSYKHSRTYTLTLRATRTGSLKIPPSVLTANGRTYKTEAIAMIVRKGHVANPGADRQRQAADPFAAFGFPPMPQMPQQPEELDVDEDNGPPGNVPVPHNDSDLFLRATLDKSEVYVGEQTTLSLYLYSRVDLAQVEPVSMPKLDGFWSEDIDSPSTLSAEPQTLNGVPYRAYLVKRRALFPLKSGELQIEPAEADITTGYFFAGRRVHRSANPLTVKVKPLPPGAPDGFVAANVGSWKLGAEAAPQEVELGSPVTVRVTLEGKGNVRNTVLPKLTGPSALHIYDPTLNEKVGVSGGRITGRRTQEYLVVPQQTGTFTLPPLQLPYFDPESRRYEVGRTEAITLHVKPGAGGATHLGTGVAQGAGSEPKNVLNEGGIRPLRYAAHFSSRAAPLWRRPYFWPTLLVPPGAWVLLGLVGALRGRLSREDAATASKKKARAAKGRLAGAEKLRQAGSSQDFYAEIERALMSFLEAKLGIPVGGLTREQLDVRLGAASVSADQRSRIRSLLDLCDLGRYSPGGDEAGRSQALEQAAAFMDGWTS